MIRKRLLPPGSLKWFIQFRSHNYTPHTSPSWDEQVGESQVSRKGLHCFLTILLKRGMYTMHLLSWRITENKSMFIKYLLWKEFIALYEAFISFFQNLLQLCLTVFSSNWVEIKVKVTPNDTRHYQWKIWSAIDTTKCKSLFNSKANQLSWREYHLPFLPSQFAHLEKTWGRACTFLLPCDCC